MRSLESNYQKYIKLDLFSNFSLKVKFYIFSFLPILKFYFYFFKRPKFYLFLLNKIDFILFNYGRFKLLNCFQNLAVKKSSAKCLIFGFFYTLIY